MRGVEEYSGHFGFMSEEKNMAEPQTSLKQKGHTAVHSEFILTSVTLPRPIPSNHFKWF